MDGLPDGARGATFPIDPQRRVRDLRKARKR